VQSSTAAITAEGITLQAGDLWTRGLSDVGGVRVTATGSPGRTLFVGIAREDDVDRWLAGAAHDELTDVSSGGARYVRSAGARQALTDPRAQDFWLASGTGAGAATVTWRATDGDFAVVLANADGSTGVVADVRAATQVPDLTGLGAGLLTAGIVLVLLAVALIVLGGTGLGRRHGGAPPPGGPPPGPTVAGPPPALQTAPR
jgi:hypothetical protein